MYVGYATAILARVVVCYAQTSFIYVLSISFHFGDLLGVTAFSIIQYISRISEPSTCSPFISFVFHQTYLHKIIHFNFDIVLFVLLARLKNSLMALFQTHQMESTSDKTTPDGRYIKRRYIKWLTHFGHVIVIRTYPGLGLER